MQGGANKVSHAVYTKADLSQPYQPYTRDTTPATDDGPRITRYALAETPFFIRVWLRPNVTSATYSLYSRRFVGTGPKDAIPLLRSWPCRGEARVGALHSPDNPDTPVDDFDSVWFTARLDRTYPGVSDYTSTVTVKDIDGEMFGLVVLRDDGGLGFEVIEERTHGPDPIVVTFNHNQHGRLYVLVRREEPNPRPFDARSFTVLLETNACYLYSNGTERGARALGGDARLICFDETDGFAGSESGSDNIQINVGVNGMNAAHIPHSDDLAFDDDTRRDIVMPTIAYTSGEVRTGRTRRLLRRRPGVGADPDAAGRSCRGQADHHPRRAGDPRRVSDPFRERRRALRTGDHRLQRAADRLNRPGGRQHA